MGTGTGSARKRYERQTKGANISTKRYSGREGKVERLHGVRVEFAPGPKGRPTMRELPGTEFDMEVELVLLAMGFLGPERNTVLAQLGVAITDRGTVAVDANKMTSVQGVFAAGDTARGQSLVVWAISEGRQAAKGVGAEDGGVVHHPLPRVPGPEGRQVRPHHAPGGDGRTAGQHGAARRRAQRNPLGFEGARFACDMPFASPGLLEAARRLMVQEEADVVIAKTDEGFEPIHAVYRRATCLPAIEEAINADKWKVIAWFPRVKVRS